MNLIFMGIIPFVLLIVLNSLMLRNLVRQNRSRAENAANMTLCNAKEVALAKVSRAEIMPITRLTFRGLSYVTFSQNGDEKIQKYTISV